MKIFRFKTKKDKEIERLNELVKTLLENCAVVETSRTELISELEGYKKKFEETEIRRRAAAGKSGGLTVENKKLRKQLEEKDETSKKQLEEKDETIKNFHETICEMKEVMKKRDKDYLFVIRLLFNEVKMEKHTRDYLRQKMKELKEKYPTEEEEWVVINVDSKSKSITHIGSKGTYSY